ncbi:LysM and putative peptidoglycan-binding domain-containing protein 3 [Blomia tropicalis]|nr:LysM and putative peptidoglycan-binding domain-containing protein 3 [Blomia tropicalis]
MYHKLINEADDHEIINHERYELKNRIKDRNNSSNSLQNDQKTCDRLMSDNVTYIHHQIQENETLQGIALRYGCSVSKLRFHNLLITDQEFYNLTTIKIPVIKHSVLNETNATRFVDDLIDIDKEEDQQDNTTPKTQIINIGISNYLNNINNDHDYNKFLNNLSDDFKAIQQSTLLKMESKPLITTDEGEEVTPVSSSQTNPALSCDDSDFHWGYLIVALIIICLLVPSYVLFNLEHPHSWQLSNWKDSFATNATAIIKNITNDYLYNSKTESVTIIKNNSRT